MIFKVGVYIGHITYGIRLYIFKGRLFLEGSHDETGAYIDQPKIHIPVSAKISK